MLIHIKFKTYANSNSKSNFKLNPTHIRSINKIKLITYSTATVSKDEEKGAARRYKRSVA